MTDLTQRADEIINLFDEYCMGDKGKRKWIADDSDIPRIYYVSDNPSRYSFSPEPDICQVTSGIGCDQVTLGQILEKVPGMATLISDYKEHTEKLEAENERLREDFKEIHKLEEKGTTEPRSHCYHYLMKACHIAECALKEQP